MKKLNIGAGVTYIPGFINIDFDQKADISIDLGKDKLPFETSSIDLIFSYHTLEHIPDYLFALSEIYRVLKPGGIFLLGVPYVTLTKYNLVNPYHLHNFNEHSFDFFDSSKLKGSAVEANPTSFKNIYHKHHYIGVFNLLPFPLNQMARNHLFNVVRKIDFGLCAIKNETTDVILPQKKELKKLFKKTLNTRVPYNKNETELKYLFILQSL
jgi:SAM-dependent methyltransferase